MGVSELFRFRRLFRRGRRIVDGSRHFVVGHDKSVCDAKRSPPKFPKGAHFFVSYDRDRLSASELDICNNNDGNEGTTSQRRRLGAETVVYTVLPGGLQELQQRAGVCETEESGVAVLPTTELKEVNLFR